MTLGKSLHFLVSQFPHINRNNNSTYIRIVVKIKWSNTCGILIILLNKHSINVSYFHYHHSFVRPMLVNIHTHTSLTIHGVNSLKAQFWVSQGWTSLEVSVPGSLCLKTNLAAPLLRIPWIMEAWLPASVNLAPWRTRCIVLKLLSQYSHFNFKTDLAGAKSNPFLHMKPLLSFSLLRKPL